MITALAVLTHEQLETAIAQAVAADPGDVDAVFKAVKRRLGVRRIVIGRDQIALKQVRAAARQLATRGLLVVDGDRLCAANVARVGA